MFAPVSIARSHKCLASLTRWVAVIGTWHVKSICVHGVQESRQGFFFVCFGFFWFFLCSLKHLTRHLFSILQKTHTALVQSLHLSKTKTVSDVNLATTPFKVVPLCRRHHCAPATLKMPPRSPVVKHHLRFALALLHSVKTMTLQLELCFGEQKEVTGSQICTECSLSDFQSITVILSSNSLTQGDEFMVHTLKNVKENYQHALGCTPDLKHHPLSWRLPDNSSARWISTFM